jgi:transcriptional regulator with XRE-family HTH domain
MLGRVVNIMKYEFGARLRKYREQKLLSQKEFAELIGVSNSRVSNWEQGINRPDVDMIAKICSVLDVDPNELLDITIPEELKKPTTYEGRELTGIDAELFNLISLVPEEKRDELLALIRSALKMQGLL